MKTYGRLRYGSHKDKPGGVWGIDNLEPHVAVAFKRLFPKANAALTLHVLTDNDETRADIHWFMDRYPLWTAPDCVEMLEQGKRRLGDRMAARDEVLDLNWTPPPAGDMFKPGFAPYFYQEQVVPIALGQGGLLLADDVGLGKTNTTYTLAARGAPLPMLAVVQPHLLRQWEARGNEFTNLRVHRFQSSQPYNMPVADVYVASYNMLAGWTPVFEKSVFPSVAYDEIQELRHGTSTQKGQAARVLSKHAQFKVGLTATPTYNYGDEIHTVMSYLNEDLLGTRDEFLREWCGQGGTVKDPDALGSFLQNSGWMLRRDEDHPAVDRSMPKPNILDFPLDYDEIALAKEEEMLKLLATTVLRGRFHEAGQAARELDVKMRHITGVAKAKPVAAYVKLLLREKKKVLLAGWHRDVYDMWRYALDDYDPVMYTGSESQAGKDRNVQRFVQGDSRVMMISLRSGAGLDGLQKVCSDVVFGELDWSPKVHYQLIGRLRRPGQLHQVTGHYLHVNGGSDPVLMGMLGVKEDQSRGILDPGQGLRQVEFDAGRIKILAKALLGEQA